MVRALAPALEPSASAPSSSPAALEARGLPGVGSHSAAKLAQRLRGGRAGGRAGAGFRRGGAAGPELASELPGASS